MMYEIRKLWLVTKGSSSPSGMTPAVFAGENRGPAEAALAAAEDAWRADHANWTDSACPPRMESWICAVRFDGRAVVDVQPLSLCFWEGSKHNPFAGTTYDITPPKDIARLAQMAFDAAYAQGCGR